MNPIALVALLEDGLVMIRRILSLYDKYKTISSVVGTVDDQLAEDLRHHRSVPGESIYFFILGRETVRRILPSEMYPQSFIDQLVLMAMYQSLENRPSPDAMTAIVDFAFQLGQVFQTENESFVDWTEDYLLRPADRFVLQDPVLTFIQNAPHLPAPTQLVFASLGMNHKDWLKIVEDVKTGKIGIAWVQHFDKLAGKTIRPHRSQTFLGLIHRGALSIAQTVPADLVILPGPDMFALMPGLLSRPLPLISMPKQLPDSRGITKELVDSASIEFMHARGYVQLPNRTWIHQSMTRLVQDPDDESQRIYERADRIIDTNAIDTSIGMKKASVLDSIASAITSQAVKSAKEAGYEASRDIMKRIMAKRSKPL